MSGLSAAVEAAEVGFDVVIVERNAYLGGRVSQLHHYFPKLCPPGCGLEINFRRIRQNPRIRYLTMAEVEQVTGKPGAYEVAVKVRPRFVTEKCTCCGKCAEAATQKVSDTFNLGMSQVKSAYLPFPAAFPQQFVIDPSVVGTQEGEALAKACEYGAVDLTMTEKTVSLSVGAIVWATGWEPFDPSPIPYYHYGQHKDVITNLMMERLAALDGPTGGKIVRPSDGKAPEHVAFVQCAGSRDTHYLPYCSGVCCLAALKQATYVLEQYPQATATIFYIDIRAMDRLEEFYTKVAAHPRVKLVKSKVASITADPQTGQLLLTGENTEKAEPYRSAADLVVLSSGMVPNTATRKLPAEAQYDAYGFVAAAPAGAAIAGCVRRPMDVSMCVQDGTAAALRAIQTVSRR
ncbi:MAG: CoB--CoM heterodisulfide reductase iron-sulfur subunit A family protein [Deltaproteobacteria bacterium]|nr:CoB--CoM heterodisulfide reductase iron-sulfur subunit A family protein [Deltaproteobacteria bacterium]